MRVAALSYQGVEVRLEKRMVCLNDMWRASGGPRNKDPRQWVRLDTTQELVEVLGLTVGKSHVLKSRAGKTGGTWAIPNLAIAYAKYLSPQFHAWANQAIIERIEEERDPELGVRRSRERAIRAWERAGKSPRWIQNRLAGIGVRHNFTDTLKAHGVNRPFEYGVCTNAIYVPVLGSSAKEEKLARELSDGDNLRDHLSDVELSAISLSESLAGERIDTQSLRGPTACEHACRQSGTAVRKAVMAYRSFPAV